MRDEKLAAILTRLDRIIQILEDQTYVPEDAKPVCPHAHAIDRGVMGDKPGEKMECRDCGQFFSRTKE